MKKYKKKDLLKSLKKVGLKSGDLIYICPQLYTLGNLEEAKNSLDYFNIFYKSIKNIIGPNGTICINAYSFQISRYGGRFILEKTPCSSGEFSELVRKIPGSIRSIHPCFSVVATGKLKKKICSKNSASSYGYGSPYDKFLKYDGKILNLGMSPAYNPYQHVAEFQYGVPYKYDKLLNTKVYVRDKLIKKDFFSYVRYLHLKWYYDLNELEKNLKKNNIIKSEIVGSGQIHYFSAKRYLSCALDTLNKNPFSFLNNKPYFKKNKIPFDGTSIKNEKKFLKRK